MRDGDHEGDDERDRQPRRDREDGVGHIDARTPQQRGDGEREHERPEEDELDGGGSTEDGGRQSGADARERVSCRTHDDEGRGRRDESRVHPRPRGCEGPEQPVEFAEESAERGVPQRDRGEGGGEERQDDGERQIIAEDASQPRRA
jgi:AAA ATPase containing von Willebrand factor type A (vWA) domain